MKRFIRLFLLLALALILAAVTLTGCGKKDPGTETTGESGQTPPEVRTVVLDPATYLLVRDEDAKSGDASYEGTLEINRIFKAAGLNFKVGTDWDEKKGPEIQVGARHREQTQALTGNLEANGYIIAMRDGDLILAGQNDNALRTAVTVFTQTILPGLFNEVSGQYEIAEDFAVSGIYDDRKVSVLVYSTDYIDVEQLQGALSRSFASVNVYRDATDFSALLQVKESPLAILVGAAKAPFGLRTAVEKYLEQGGQLIYLGDPPFQSVMYEKDGRFVDGSDYLYQSVLELDDRQALFEIEDEARMNRYERHADNNKGKILVEVDDFGLDSVDADQARLTFTDVQSWDLFVSDKTCRKTDNALGFWLATEEAGTLGVYVEVTETSGCRYYAVASATRDWQYFLLNADDFKFWSGDASRKNTPVRIGDVAKFKIGFAQSGSAVAVGEHILYLAQVESFATEDGELKSEPMPIINGFTPLYELYPVTNGASVSAGQGQSVVPQDEYKLPGTLYSAHPGRQGTGYSRARESRFIPLLEVRDSKGLHAGYAAWMYQFFNDSQKKNSSVAVFSAQDKAFYDNAGYTAVCRTAEYLLGSGVLVEGGTDEYVYIASETSELPFGATVRLSDTARPEQAQIRLTFLKDGKPLEEKTQTLSELTAKNGRYSFTGKYTLGQDYPDQVWTELLIGGVVKDILVQDLTVWVPKPENERRYIYKEDGYFKRDGKILTFFGVNYMPTYGVAEQDSNLFEHYVSRPSYDHDVVEADLARIAELGMNAVSVFGYRETVDQSNDLLDLILLCEKYGLYVDVSLRPYCYPYHQNYSPEVPASIIKKLHLWDLDNLIAYDIAWEHTLGQEGSYSRVNMMEQSWRDWLETQYGSIAKAEAAWGTALPKSGGKVTVPGDALLNSSSAKDAPLIAAYRRFLDDQVAKDYAEAARLMRTVDPNHLISFRMASAGSAEAQLKNLYYDFRMLAPALDVMEPEGYALAADENTILQVVLCNAYARAVAPDEPVVWKEFGRHVWNGSNFIDNSAALKVQKDYYSYVLDACFDSYSNGMFAWYFAGGYRINENSDYGIVNPDGSDRPATALIREYAKKFIGQGEMPAAAVTASADRDTDPRGLYAMYQTLKSKLQQAYQKNGRLELTNLSEKEGPVYADEVYTQTIGTPKDGDPAPLKYVNGIIQYACVATENGRKVLKITYENTQDAVWRAGTVILVSASGKVSYTIGTDLSKDKTRTLTLDYDGDGKETLYFELSADGKTVRFGNPYTMQ